MKQLLLIALSLLATAILSAQCPSDKIPPLLWPKGNAKAALGGSKCIAVLRPADLLDSYSDNCTPKNKIKLGVRRLGDGHGFPLEPSGLRLTLVPADLPGPVLVEVWAQDSAKNTAFTFVAIQLTNPAGCSFALLPDTLQAGVVLDNFTWAMKTVSGPTSDTVYISGDGPLPLDEGLLAGANQDNEITIWPIKDDYPFNGVSTYDLVLINKHILGLSPPFQHPVQQIAADADRNNVVTVHDMTELRKLILGIYTELPNSPSCRFIADDYLFSPPSHPIAGPIPESVTFDRHRTEPLPDFIAVKIGDINGNAVTSSLVGVQDRGLAALTISDMRLERGQTVFVPVRISDIDELMGMQAAFEFDPEQLRVLTIQPGVLPDFSTENFFQPEPGLLTLSWANPLAGSRPANAPLFFIELTAYEPLVLSEAFRLRPARLQPEVYDAFERISDLSLAFDPLAPALAMDEIRPAFPNPANGDFFVPVRIVQDGPVRLEVLDNNGRIVFFREMELPLGEHLMRVSLEQAGAFLYRVTAGAVLLAHGNVVSSRK